MSDGSFGNFGGAHVPPQLQQKLNTLQAAYDKFAGDADFLRELDFLYAQFAARPSVLYHARSMSADLGGAQIYLKREDLNHTGSHKINNVLGQALLAKKMGAQRLIAETGAGQHGVATATVAALMNMPCEIYMGARDIKRQSLNVYRMKLLGARVHSVTDGTATLSDAVDAAIEAWMTAEDSTHYLIGSVVGPHPFPTMVRDFQAIIGREIRSQMQQAHGRLPDCIIACVGGGSNAIGAFYDFLPDASVELVGVEAAGEGIDTPKTAAAITVGQPGIFHGMSSYFMQSPTGSLSPAYSISAGLDYPGIGPEHASLHESGRARYVAVTDEAAVTAFEYLCATEGIIPAIESAHAIAYAMEYAPTLSADKIVVINLSGRGDKDVGAIEEYRGSQAK